MSVVGMKFSADQGVELANVKAVLFRKERELKEAHHRIANSLQLASGFLNFQKKRSCDPQLQAALDIAAARLGAVGKLHRYLYAHSADAAVDLKRFLEDLCPAIAESTGLTCAVYADPINVSGEMAQNLAIIINEFALNAGKHAYDGVQGGRLEIECRREHDQIRVAVADGGRGLPAGFDADGRKGLGLTIVGSIVRQLNGALSTWNDHGAHFAVSAPLMDSALVPNSRLYSASGTP